MQQNSSPLGFNVIGYASGNLGMGVTARQFIQLLIKKGCAVAILDLDPGLNRMGHDKEFQKYSVTSAQELPHAINLILLNISELPDFFLHPPTGLFRVDRLNVGLIWWELTVLPRHWIEALQLFDVLIAGSDFVRHVFESNLSDTPTIPAIHPVFLPEGVQPDPIRFGLPGDALLFLTSFDTHSDPARKNPFSAIRAFQRAFHDSTNTRLIIKLNNTYSFRQTSAAGILKELELICEEDNRIQIISESLSYLEILRLYASCDVFVSLHRAEGLGLGPLEAMSLGKAVIATAWSGNLTYMTHRNSCLVGYQLVPISGNALVYTSKFLGAEASWAEPSIEEAAAWMSKLAVDPTLRLRIGQTAEKDARQLHSQALKGEFVEELTAMLEQHTFLPQGKTTKYSKLHGLREAMYMHRLRSQPWWTRSLMQLKKFLGQHVLWRFS